MLEIMVRVTAPWDPIGAKERIIADLERYGDVRVVSVRETGAWGGEQMGLFQRGER